MNSNKLEIKIEFSQKNQCPDMIPTILSARVPLVHVDISMSPFS